MINKQKWILRTYSLDPRAHLQLLHTLFTSRWHYAAEFLASISKSFKTWSRSQWYQSIRNLLGIRHDIQASRLFEVCLGMPWECWMEEKARRLFAKLGISRKPRICSHTTHNNYDPKAPLPLQVAAKEKAEAFMKLKLYTSWRGWQLSRSGNAWKP